MWSGGAPTTGASADPITENAIAIGWRTVVDVSHIAQGVPDAANAAQEKGFPFFANAPWQPPETLAHNLVVLSGVHGFATRVAAARSASQKGACYVPVGGPGVIPPLAVAQSPVSTS
jgi:hypothetical protein